MAYQKLNYSQALQVINSDTVRIPDPNSLILSLANETGDFTAKNKLVVSAGGLLDAGIQPNAIVYCPGDAKCWYVVNVVDDNTLEIIGDDDTGSSGALFNIYNRAAEGCNLYTGDGGDLTVVMAEMNHSWVPADDVVGLSPITFKSVCSCKYHPINVLMVRKTGTTLSAPIIALW